MAKFRLSNARNASRTIEFQPRHATTNLAPIQHNFNNVENKAE